MQPISAFDVLTFTRTEDGAEVTVNLGETVYGGTVDLETGVLTITRAVLVIDGDEAGGSINTDQSDDTTILFQMRVSAKTDVTQRTLDICDRLPHALVHNPTYPGANAQSKLGKPCFSFHSSEAYANYLYIRLDRSWLAGETLADAQAWLAANPLTITYGLIEPRVVQLTPQVMAAIDGKNTSGAKIAAQMAATRTEDPDNLASMPNYGMIDGFPVIVEMNGEFHGLYSLTIPKDPWMMSMGGGTNEAILCADKHVDATRFKAEALCDGTDFKIEYVPDENNAGWVKESLNAMINACINSDGTDIDTTVAQRLNLTSMMDHMIYVTVFDGHDNSDKNYTISTKNGVRWFIGEYDLDSILGMWYDGSYFRPATEWLRNFEWWSIHNRAAYLIYTYKRAELKARYLELRAGVLSEDNVVTTITNYVSQIPANAFRADQERWPLLPNTSVNNVARAADWYRRRVAYIDKEVNGWT